MYQLLREGLVLAAFTTAHADALGSPTAPFAALRADPANKHFFDTWSGVEATLRTFASLDAGYDEDRLWRIAELLLEFFRHCGFQVFDVPKGMYIRVSEPDLR